MFIYGSSFRVRIRTLWTLVYLVAQSTEAVEYADCIFVEG